MLSTDAPLVINRVERSHVRFYVIGDFGSGDAGQARVAEAMTLIAARDPPDFILGTGDAIYPLEGADPINPESLVTVLAERFDPYYDQLGVDFYQCIGNEDLLCIFGGDATLMVASTQGSATWRMPSPSYRITGLPPWIAIHVVNTTVFGFGDCLAEATIFSDVLMAREIEAVSETFTNANGLKILVGHHPIFTPGKRTFHYNADGEMLYMRHLRQVIEDCGVHFYFSGHEHHQSHITGRTCEHITQGCGGARQRPNPKHSRREQGWRDVAKALRYLEIMAGFAVVDAYSPGSVRLRFFGIPFGEAVHEVKVIHECRWQSVSEIGDCNLRSCT